MTDEERAALDAAVARHWVPAAGPRVAMPPPAEVWAGRVPDALLHLWAAHGLASFASGRLRLIDPDLLAPVIAFAVRGDPDLDGDTWPIALGRFGQVVVWSERHGAGFWEPRMPSLEMPWLGRPPARPAAQIIEMVVALPPVAVDWLDAEGRSILPALETILPEPAWHEIWGATPVPVPLEDVPPEDFVPAPAADWLEALHAEASTMLVDWNQPDTPELRLVGDPWPAGAQRRMP